MIQKRLQVHPLGRSAILSKDFVQRLTKRDDLTSMDLILRAVQCKNLPRFAFIILSLFSALVFLLTYKKYYNYNQGQVHNNAWMNVLSTSSAIFTSSLNTWQPVRKCRIMPQIPFTWWYTIANEYFKYNGWFLLDSRWWWYGDCMNDIFLGDSIIKRLSRLTSSSFRSQ